ncbi:ATPase, T2SS/T4P/T4SS family (plasmid) [Oscillospiraceae bacterium MB08-C2-2]|nr:ATPase, T2SS/T4P/T4SS family [Oscillospiraceae bacterium MB08-C2-2]
MKTMVIPSISVSEALPYPDILRLVQDHMSRSNTDLLNVDELSIEQAFLFKQLIETYLRENGIAFAELSITDLVERLYLDMKLFGFLTPYLQPETIEKLGLEEIRVNSWESVFLVTSKEGKIRLREKFLSPSHAQDIILRLLQKSKMTIDTARPYALGHLGKNQRIGVFKTPILDDEIGVSATIRIVFFSKLIRQNLIDWKTATPEMLDFMEMCLGHGISICVAGATGSGKTGSLGYLLSQIAKDDATRVLTIEEGSREFDLVRRDEAGSVINDVVHLLTRKSEQEATNITQNTLLEQVLRHTPDLLGIGEMRSIEAYTAIEASYTDHTIGTTTHAPNAPLTYERMVMLAAKGTSSFSEESLFRKAITAFPIIVYQEELPDGTRRITEIIEGLEYRDGKVVYNTLYRFDLERTEYDGLLGIVTGRFERMGTLSNHLQKRLARRGVAWSVLQKYIQGGESQ